MQVVQRWETTDGVLHLTEEDAIRHDERRNIAQIIESLTCYGNVDPGELLEALTATTGPSLGAYVAIYQRSWNKEI